MTIYISPNTTLRELMNIVPDTNGCKTPTSRILRDSSPLLTKVDFAGGTLEVYQNGYFIYSTGGNCTVAGIHSCASDYYYEYVDSKKVAISVDDLQDLPFAIRLAIEGERRLELNHDRRDREHMRSYDVFEFDSEALAHNDIDIEMYGDKDELCRAMLALTQNQREIIDLVFVQGYSQADVAKMKGCSEPAITESLKRARKKIRKILDMNR